METKNRGIQFYWYEGRGANQKRRERTFVGRPTKANLAAFQQELETELNASGRDTGWKRFFRRCKSEYIETMEPRAQEKPRTMLRQLAKCLKSQDMWELACSEIDEEIPSLIEQEMRTANRAPSTIKSNMQTLWCILNWGADVKMLPRLHRPRRRRRKSDKTAKTESKGRALSGEEVERMLDAIDRNPIVRPQDKPNRQRVLATGESAVIAKLTIEAITLTGFRLDDCHRFSWSEEEGCHFPVGLDTLEPRIAYCSKQKSGAEEEIPLTKMAAEFLLRIQPKSKTGFPFRMTGQRGHHKTPNRLGRVIANAGLAARIIAKKTGGKYGTPKFASAHDLRRTHARFLLDNLNVKDAATMMRHASTDTLLRYYADSFDGDLAKKLRQLFSSVGGSVVDGTGAVFAKSP